MAPSDEQHATNSQRNTRFASLFESEKAADAFAAIFAAVTTLVTTITLFQDRVLQPITTPVRLKIEELHIGAEIPKAASPLPGTSSGTGTPTQAPPKAYALIPVTIRGVITNKSNTISWLLKPHWILYGNYLSQGPASAARVVEADSQLAMGSKMGFKASRNLILSANAGLSQKEQGVSPILLSDADIHAYLQDITAAIKTMPPGTSTKYLLGMGPLATEFELQPEQQMRFQRVLFMPKDIPFSHLQAVITIPVLRKTQLTRSTFQVDWLGCLATSWPPIKCDLTTIEKAPANNVHLVFWRRNFCEYIPFEERNSKLKISEFFSIYKLSPFQARLTAAAAKRPIQRQGQPAESRAENFCSQSMTGIEPYRQSRLGASDLTVVHEEPFFTKMQVNESPTKP